MDINTVLKRNPELLAVDMDGETVMMDMESGNYFGINAVGSHIWEVLEAECSVQSVLDSVQSNFVVENGENVQDEVLLFLNDMCEQKLFEVSNA